MVPTPNDHTTSADANNELLGRTLQRSVLGCTVRPAQLADVKVCDIVSRQVHGFSRTVELAEAIQQGTASVIEREGRMTGYATVLAFFCLLYTSRCV